MKMSIEGLTGGFGVRVASCYFQLKTLRAICVCHSREPGAKYIKILTIGHVLCRCWIAQGGRIH